MGPNVINFSCDLTPIIKPYSSSFMPGDYTQLLDEVFVISSNCFLVHFYHHTEHTASLTLPSEIKSALSIGYRLINYLLAENWQISPVGCAVFQNQL